MNKEQFQKHCEMQANWWIAAALTGHATKRKILRSDEHSVLPREMTDDEKISDALQTAQNHIQAFRESCES